MTLLSAPRPGGRPAAPPGPKTPEAETDPLAEFASEADRPPERVTTARTPSSEPGPPRRAKTRWGLMALFLIIGAGLAVLVQWAVTPRAGSLRFVTEPAGAAVLVDGMPRGTAPLVLQLPAGLYDIELQYAGQSRRFTAAVTAQAESLHHITFAAPRTTTARTGGLSVTTPTPGATVLVDEVERGITPLTLDGLAPGPHDVVVRSSRGDSRQSIVVQAGLTASLVVEAAPVPALRSGWLVVEAAQPLQIVEDGRTVGTTAADRTLLPAGIHTLAFVSAELGFRTEQAVRIAPERSTTISIPMPPAPVNINAVPWAEVFIDGQRVGETPIGNLPQPLGRHDVTFRHPQLGEKQRAIVVSLAEPVRLSVDMRTP